MDFLDQMKALRDQGQPFVTATVVRVEKPASARPGAKAMITQAGKLTGWVGGSCAEPHVKQAAAQALQDGSPRLLRLCPPEKMSAVPQEGVTEVKITCASGGTLEIYIEPYLVQPQLLVVGHQAVAQALASLGNALEYSVTVIGEEAAREQFPSADVLVEGLDFSQVSVTPHTYIVVASHGNYDELALEALLPRGAAYVALVASKKRSAEILNFLRQSGIAEEALARLKYPAGLDFGAAAPAEIALSILAEIIQLHRRGSVSKRNETAAAGSPASQDAVEAAAGAVVEADAGRQDAEPEMAIDPVCGMSVEISTARHKTTYAGQTYYFCAAQCQHRFEKHPDKYLKPAKERINK
jgi:xanthine dehydrogenase accessory factor